MDKLIGAVKVMLDGYTGDRFDRLMLAYTRFINTMKQEPVIEQLLPLSGERLGRAGDGRGTTSTSPRRSACSTRC